MEIRGPASYRKLKVFHFRIFDPKIWSQKIRALKNNKAHGVCGWRNEEFKLPPYQAICHLAQAFRVIVNQGFSANLLQARTILLAKNKTNHKTNHNHGIFDTVDFENNGRPSA